MTEIKVFFVLLFVSSSGLKEEILSSFSVLSNGEKMVKMDSTPKGMGCLNGMRVLSISWIVLGHVYIFMLGFISEYLYTYNQQLLKTLLLPSYNICPEGTLQLGTCRMHHLLAMSVLWLGIFHKIFLVAV